MVYLYHQLQLMINFISDGCDQWIRASQNTIINATENKLMHVRNISQLDGAKSEIQISNRPCNLLSIFEGILKSYLPLKLVLHLSCTSTKYDKMWSNHISLMSHLYTPWKLQKTIGFLTFSGDIEMWHWTKMGQKRERS